MMNWHVNCECENKEEFKVDECPKFGEMINKLIECRRDRKMKVKIEIELHK